NAGEQHAGDLHWRDLPAFDAVGHLCQRCIDQFLRGIHRCLPPFSIAWTSNGSPSGNTIPSAIVRDRSISLPTSCQRRRLSAAGTNCASSLSVSLSPHSPSLAAMISFFSIGHLLIPLRMAFSPIPGQAGTRRGVLQGQFSLCCPLFRGMP